MTSGIDRASDSQDLGPEVEARVKAEVDWLESVMCDPGEPDEVVWPGTLTLTKRLRAFAREILQGAEFEKGCECDSCCRLEELRVKLHLPEGSADEIAGNIGHMLDGQQEALASYRATQGAEKP